MNSLLRKEIRSIRPFLVLLLFFVVLGWLSTLLTEFPDQYPLSRLMSQDNRTASQVFAFIFSFALAASALVRENDEGTLAFLDALPTSRAQIFFTKVGVALGVLWLIPLSDVVFNASLHALSRTSLDERFHWNILLTSLVLDSVSCVVYLSLGLVLSFLRHYSLLVLGLLVGAYLFLKESGAPFVPLFNVLTLGHPVFLGQHWLLPWSKLIAQLSLAAVSGGAAFVVFHFTGDRWQQLAGRVNRRRSSPVVTGVVIIGVWLGLGIYWGMTGQFTPRPPVKYESWATARANTARFQFLYPENRSTSVQPIVDGADAVEARVRSFLDAKLLGPIVVDLTVVLPRHAGLAHWKTIQMNLPFDAAADSGASLLAILAHETAHVHIDHLSGSRLHEQFDSMRFFHEGLASYIEHHFYSQPGKLDALRRVAAVLRARDEVKFEELLDGTKLQVKHDADVVYPLGEVFVTALVRRYGNDAPGKVVRALARADAPQGLTGAALWQDTFQACGFDLSELTDGFFVELDRAVTRYRSFVDSLPRLLGAVDQAAGEITVHFVGTQTAPGEIVCRLRSQVDEDHRFFEFAYSLDGVTFHTEVADYANRSFWYQLGWSVKDASQILYEPWVEVRR